MFKESGDSGGHITSLDSVQMWARYLTASGGPPSNFLFLQIFYFQILNKKTAIIYIGDF